MELENIVANTVLLKAREGKRQCGCVPGAFATSRGTGRVRDARREFGREQGTSESARQTLHGSCPCAPGTWTWSEKGKRHVEVARIRMLKKESLVSSSNLAMPCLLGSC